MTRKQTLDAIRALGMVASFDPESREYRVAPSFGPLAGGRGFQAAQRAWQEARAYYTPDGADAIGTARAMALEPDNRPG